jgi:translation initiation factor 3 subunit E
MLLAKLDVLSKTNMVDFAMEIWQKMNGGLEPPVEMKERREEVIKQLISIQQQCGPILAVVSPQEDTQESIADVLIREKVL